MKRLCIVLVLTALCVCSMRVVSTPARGLIMQTVLPANALAEDGVADESVASEKAEEATDSEAAGGTLASSEGESAFFRILPGDSARFQDRFLLPDLSRMAEEERSELVDNRQVILRIEALGIDTERFQTPELNWKTIYNTVKGDVLEQTNHSENRLSFSGNLVSELNDFLDSLGWGSEVWIQSSELTMDATLYVPGGVCLYGRGVRLIPGLKAVEKAVVMDGAEEAGISGIVIEGGCDYGIYIKNSSRFIIADNDISGVKYKGITMMGNGERFIFARNKVHDNGNGGFFLNGAIKEGILEDNRVIDNGGARNLTAGIVLSSIEIEDIETAYNPFKDVYLYDILESPNNLVLYNNHVARNHSSGIYSDSGYLNSFIANEIYGNEKEGMCLDYGSFGNYVTRNIIQHNGGRYRMSDEDLEADFVMALGRLSDGSSPAKLPGISLDNTAYNTVFCNVVTQNYGSGIKAVRSAYRNVIASNQVIDNNLGSSDKFHFFGIELSTDLNADEEVVGLDFTACYENVIAFNHVSGAHYAGAFLGPNAYINDFFDNTFIDCTDWSMECLSDRFNSTVNNLSTVQSRGISLTKTRSVMVAGPVYP